MKQYKEFAEKIKEYFVRQQEVSRGIQKNAWFEEYYEEPGQNEIFAKYRDSANCMGRVTFKEMLDSQSSLHRTRTVRNKTRADYFVGNAVRHEGTIHRLESKIENLNVD